MSRGAALLALALAGCTTTAYQNAYDRETASLEQQAAEQNAQQEQLHAQAQRYASVVYFATGSSALDSNATGELDWFVQQMQAYPQATFEVNGFADSTGTEAKNRQLSLERAQAVAAYLESQGIASSRLFLQSFSTAFPAASNVTAKGRRDNRRVEVTVR